MNAPAFHRAGVLYAGVFLSVFSAAAGHPFSFHRDTFDFANETVLEYHQGHASPRHEAPGSKPKRFVQHCFVMSRSVAQFRKFARFDPALPPLDDKELAARVRTITSQIPWAPPRPAQDRLLIPGHSNLRELSRSRPEILQENIGLGWTTYFRPGNWRVLLPHGPSQQARTQETLERTLDRGEFFVAYLTNIPKSLNINHGVLVYSRLKSHGRENKSGNVRYQVYDPNHSDRPRILEWSSRDSSFLYQRDTDFVGGHVVVWQVYGHPFQ